MSSQIIFIEISTVSWKTIPSSVTSMYEIFSGCTNLTGTIIINANPTSYSECFYGTEKPIVLTGSSTMLQTLANTANKGNVTVSQ